MPVGPFINSLAVLIGGLFGGFLEERIPERLRNGLPLTFGLASMAMGVVLIAKVVNMPVMVLSLILGAMIGELIYLEKKIGVLGGKTRTLVERIVPPKENAELSQEDFLEKFVAILVLFCASGTGIFGAMKEGMTGDSSVLIAKAFLDLFTAAIFATSLGYSVALISIPQLAIQLALFFGAQFIMPYTNDQMIANFSAVGGALMLATGLRICGIKIFPVANLLPALLFAMPLTPLWTHFF